MQALIPLRCRRSAILAAAVAGALAAGAANAGGLAVGRPAVVIPAHPPRHAMPGHRAAAHMHPRSPALAIIRPAVPPVFFHPVVPGFVTFVPPVVIVTPVVAPVHPAHPVPLPAPVLVQPHVPVLAPSSPLFFAPPVQTVVSPAGGQVLIIRRTGH